jgi:DNA-binding NarL/FixJ family response regulator
LTSRELEIVGHLADGDSNRDIARRLTISEATVKSHLVHIFGKLGVDSRTPAVAVARRRGML